MRKLVWLHVHGCKMIEKTMQKYLDLEGEPFQEGREESLERPCTGNSQNCIAIENKTFYVNKTICTCNQMAMGS